jgi:GGDEF domain-containing protein
VSTNIALAINKNLPDAEFSIGETGLDSLVWLSENIDRPTDEQINEWLQENLFLDWDKLTRLLTNSQYFEKAYQASKKTLNANSAFTLLMATITNTKNVNTLRFSFNELLTAMKASTQILSYTAKELQEIKTLLNNCGFDGEAIIND